MFKKKKPKTPKTLIPKQTKTSKTRIIITGSGANDGSY